MARPRTFDPQETLEKVQDIFWQRGYDGTSLSDLVEATQISRSSFYEVFGDKEQAFAQTLAAYRAKALITLETFVYQTSGNALTSLDEMLEAHFPLDTDTCQKGCYMLNSVVELGPRHPDWAQDFEQHRQAVIGLYAVLLERAHQQGLLATSLGSRELGQMLYFLVTGLQAQQRIAPDREAALKEARNFLRLISK